MMVDAGKRTGGQDSKWRSLTPTGGVFRTPELGVFNTRVLHVAKTREMLVVVTRGLGRNNELLRPRRG